MGAMQDAVSRRRFVAWAGACFLPIASGCATRAAQLTVAALSPTGRLRASINLGNPILTNRDPATGQAVGVSVDLARALAGQLGVDVELLVVDAVGKSVAAVKSGHADVGFFAIDPLRNDGIRFTAPYMLISAWSGTRAARRSSPNST